MNLYTVYFANFFFIYKAEVQTQIKNFQNKLLKNVHYFWRIVDKESLHVAVYYKFSNLYSTRRNCGIQFSKKEKLIHTYK